VRAVVSVSLPNEMAVRLNELVDASGRAKSEIVKEALRRYLWEERFDALRLRLGKKARARGLVTDEDVLNTVS